MTCMLVTPKMNRFIGHRMQRLQLLFFGREGRKTSPLDPLCILGKSSAQLICPRESLIMQFVGIRLLFAQPKSVKCCRIDDEPMA